MDTLDKALGEAIRRRRNSTGLNSKDVAERVGMNAAVYGRIELGTRPCRAHELGEIAKVLGVTADDLLRGMNPVTAEELVERASAQRDITYAALHDYANTVLEAAQAVTDTGACVDNTDMHTVADLARWLSDSSPSYIPLRVPDGLSDPIRGVLVSLAESVALREEG